MAKPDKLKIFVEEGARENLIVDPDGSISVQFNPTTYSISKSVSWQPPSMRTRGGAGNDAKFNAPQRSFGGGGSRKLSLELFFDTTEETDPFFRDVRNWTDLIVQLTEIVRDSDNPRPPLCTVHWGGSSADFPFSGTVSQLDQQFLLFDENGKPVRAQLKVEFVEFLNMKDDLLKTDPDLSTRVVRRGDTLASIAAEAYNDPAAWRVIASANRLENPLALAPGMKLTLPKQ